MKSYNILTMIALLFASLGFAGDDIFDFDQAWKRVDAAISKGLPKTALTEINQIYDAAVQEKNVTQQLKATISGAKLVLDTEELGLEAIVGDLEKKLQGASSPAKEILHSMTAELFDQYYRNQYYKISQRTDLTNHDTGDIRTWAPNNYRDYIAGHYLSSVRGNLRGYQTEEYKELLLNAEKAEVSLRPSLQDLLIDRALQYFSARDNRSITSSFTFEMDDPKYYSVLSKFIDLQIDSTDSDSKLLRALQLFHNQLCYLTEEKNEELMADYDLRRLEFVNMHAQVSDKKSLFMEALIAGMKERVPKFAGMYGIRLAQEYINDGKYEEALSILNDEISTEVPPYVSATKKNLIANIYQKSLYLQTEQVVPSDKGFLVYVTSRNLDKIYYKIVKAEGDDLRKVFGARRDDQINRIEKLKVVRSWSTDKVRSGLGQSSYEEVVDGLPYGTYMIIASNDPGFVGQSAAYQYAAFYVSDLAHVSYKSVGKNQVSVRDRSTGQPVAGATVDVYTRKYNRSSREYDLTRVQSSSTTASGMMQITSVNNDGITYKISKGADRLSLEEFDYFYKMGPRNYENQRTEILLDRAIYRPGQTVHYKTISMQIDENGLPTIDENKEVYVVLRDANYQVVSEVKLKANEYGSSTGSFELPTGRLTGSFTITANEASKSFSVEEYKRPKFEVEFDKMTDEVRLGDAVSLTGVAQALSGAPSSDAKVTFTVMRHTYVGWWSWYRRAPSRSEMIRQGALSTDAQGKFIIDFETNADPDTKLEDNPTYSYHVVSNVTDLSGETRTAETTIAVSALPYSLIIDMQEVADVTDVQKVNLKALTAEEAPVATTAILRITELVSPDKWTKPRIWGHPTNQIIDKKSFEDKIDRISYLHKSQLSFYPAKEVIHTATVAIGKDGLIFDFSKFLKGGKAYKIELTSAEKYDGIAVTSVQYAAISDQKRGRYHVSDLLYIHQAEAVAVVGEKYEIKIGTPDQSLDVYYTIMRDEEVLQEGMVRAGNERKIYYTPVEKDRGGISIHFDYIKHNYYQQDYRQIALPWDHKKLKVELVTKRDKVLPGSKEEWQIKISGEDKDRSVAELLATMYDASLDQFVSHSYSFDPYVSHYGRLQSRMFGFGTGQSNGLNYQWNTIGRESVVMPVVPSLKGINYGYTIMNENLYDGVYMQRTSKKMRSSSPQPTMDEVQVMSEDAVSYAKDGDFAAGNAAGVMTEATEQESGPSIGSAGTPPKEISIRKNLNESVFFFPQMMTDANGDITLNFTMNEALTTWKLITFAHDKELRYGMTSHEVKTQKDVMILPNAPRFFREGDKITFPATISNLSNMSMTAVARLELRDAVTDEVISPDFGLGSQIINIDVPQGESVKVDWQLSVPADYKKMVKYVATVQAGVHTDGEENIVPVMTNQVLVTESEVISVKKQQTVSVLFEELMNKSATAIPHRYTLEYTSNPVWYAVQALPYLMEYPHQCTEQVFNRMYANQMASHIASSSPKIKGVFDAWKAVGSDALLSNLEKNEELKSAIIEESPWVRQAQSETEQKKRIGLLFDMNNMAAELEATIAILQERQMPSGAFPWFVGGRENVYITQNVVEGILHLQHLGIIDQQDSRLSGIITRAMQFLHEASTKRYDRLVENVKKYGGDINKDHLDYLSIHYLYITSFASGGDIPDKAKKAYDYYQGQSQKYWPGKGLYSEAMIGLSLHRAQKSEVTDIRKSLTERSFFSDELGRYWNIGSGFNWYELPIETHAMMIEFYAEVDTEGSFVEDMKIWLLKNKQTNHWKTTKATSAAIYALLIQGEDGGMISWVDQDAKSDIYLGGKKLEVSADDLQAGTGYFKEAWMGTDIKPELGDIKIVNQGETIAWGAAYYQYFEDMDKVDDFQETPLEVTKELFVEVMTNNGSTLVNIADRDINPGDRVISRIEVRVDRSMSYVHLKDMRASGFEPENVLSGYRYQGGLGYYESTRDLASHFFISQLDKGSYVFEYPMRAVHKGDFSDGMATIQCMYAPEFLSHSKGQRIQIK